MTNEESRYTFFLQVVVAVMAITLFWGYFKYIPQKEEDTKKETRTEIRVQFLKVLSLQENLNLEQSDPNPTAIERLQEEKKEFAKTLKWEEGVVNVGRWEIAPTGIITGLLLID